MIAPRERSRRETRILAVICCIDGGPKRPGPRRSGADEALRLLHLSRGRSDEDRPRLHGCRGKVPRRFQSRCKADCRGEEGSSRQRTMADATPTASPECRCREDGRLHSFPREVNAADCPSFCGGISQGGPLGHGPPGFGRTSATRPRVPARRAEVASVLADHRPVPAFRAFQAR